MVAVPLLTGCALVPDVVHQPQYHNPFPQLKRVAVLPFYNQSADPTIDQQAVAMAYYNELQQVPGFEVMPVGVATRMMEASGLDPKTGDEWQQLAQALGVDAIVVGSVTEYSPYYPPRLGLAVNWYAANPGFHPIPPGYGLPWGTSQQDDIPESVVFEAEFALAREQLETQTPELRASAPVQPGESEDALPPSQPEADAFTAPGGGLPADWPDPRGFIPPPPLPSRPPLMAQHDPVMEHTRLYQGNDAEFARRLAKYFYLRDDARFGGWQGYLQRSDDFIRFCCHLHVTEMLAERGGAGKTQVVWRWPIGRYER
jgi:hypothetical protein